MKCLWFIHPLLCVSNDRRTLAAWRAKRTTGLNAHCEFRRHPTAHSGSTIAKRSSRSQAMGSHGSSSELNSGAVDKPLARATRTLHSLVGTTLDVHAWRDDSLLMSRSTCQARRRGRGWRKYIGGAHMHAFSEGWTKRGGRIIAKEWMQNFRAQPRDLLNAS